MIFVQKTVHKIHKIYKKIRQPRKGLLFVWLAVFCALLCLLWTECYGLNQNVMSMSARRSSMVEVARHSTVSAAP